MKDLEKELVEKLCECDAKNGYVCVLHREALPLIRSHTQALVAAAYARATNLIAQVRDDYHSNDGPFDMGMRLQMLENEVCSLTPADAARELERRELEARIEQMKKVMCLCPLHTLEAANDWMNGEIETCGTFGLWQKAKEGP